MDEVDFRAKFSSVKLTGKCMDCLFLPPVKPRRRCEWCQLKKDGTDAEVTASYARKEATQAYSEDFREPGFGFCVWCTSIIPNFYMQSGKRCRGCGLVAQRDGGDKRKYGMKTGGRQSMYDAQDGRCFGCGNRQLVTGLSVHHSHLDGTAFFLSCLTCNKLVMGNAFDNPITLLRLGLGMLWPPHENNNMERIERWIKEITGV